MLVEAGFEIGHPHVDLSGVLSAVGVSPFIPQMCPDLVRLSNNTSRAIVWRSYRHTSGCKR
jgi:hypothetical protein